MLFLTLIFCTATSEPSGEVDVKENAKTVHFSVCRNSTFSEIDATVSFEHEKVNVGGAMKVATGVFTAPFDGVYHFEFSGLTKDVGVQIFLKVNGENLAFTGVAFSSSMSNRSSAPFYTTVSIAISLQLKRCDKVSLYKRGDGMLYQQEGISGVPNTFFTGWLVDSLLSPSYISSNILLEKSSSVQSYLFTDIFLLSSFFSLLKNVVLLYLLRFASFYWDTNFQSLLRGTSIFIKIAIQFATPQVFSLVNKLLVLLICIDLMFITSGVFLRMSIAIFSIVFYT